MQFHPIQVHNLLHKHDYTAMPASLEFDKLGRMYLNKVVVQETILLIFNKLLNELTT